MPITETGNTAAEKKRDKPKYQLEAFTSDGLGVEQNHKRGTEGSGLTISRRGYNCKRH